MSIEDKEVLKAIGKLLYIISSADHNFHDEEFTVKKILIDSFGLTEGETLDIKNEAHKKGDLINVVINSVQTINEQNNKVLELTVLGLVTSIAADDGKLAQNESGILKVIKDKLLNDN